MGDRNTGQRNAMWKGGRSVASNGYVLVRVGINHHLADVRGYAYEHRLVAEQKMGRRLRKGEQVHHINGDKSDNRPDNLEICASVAHHHLHHRISNCILRLPDEENPIIECACGCGQTFNRYDETGRPRSYVSGHNPMPAPTTDLILTALVDGPKDLKYLGELHGNLRAVKVACSKLVGRGRIVRLGRGIYGRADQN